VGRGGCEEKSWVEVNGGDVGAVGAVADEKPHYRYHALHLTVQTPFTTHNPSMPPHCRYLRLSAYTVLECRIHT
jgi:hypothetical protein